MWVVGWLHWVLPLAGSEAPKRDELSRNGLDVYAESLVLVLLVFLVLLVLVLVLVLVLLFLLLLLLLFVIFCFLRF